MNSDIKWYFNGEKVILDERYSANIYPSGKHSVYIVICAKIDLACTAFWDEISLFTRNMNVIYMTLKSLRIYGVQVNLT